MRLYAGTSEEFVADSVHNRIADKLRSAYFASYRREASHSEVNSWKNSLRALSQVFQVGGFKGHGVLLEYELPLTSRRLDCLLTGRDDLLNDHAAIIELKQWEKCEQGDAERIVTFVGRNNRDVLHPSVQVGQYRRYLSDYQPAFYEGEAPVGLRACAYLHNYTPNDDDALFAPQYTRFIDECPLFTGDDVPKLTDFLRQFLVKGDDQHALRRILEGKFRPSKKLLDHIGRVLDGKPEYVLLDEQLIAFERVIAAARAGVTQRQKAAIIIRGGPGTGKSVIALNLMSALAREGICAHYVTGSKAFTETLRKIVGERADAQVNYFNSYMQADFNEHDVLLCDEAHRIRETSNNRFMVAARRSNRTQIEELFHAGKVLVFFVDDRQVVRPGEIGSAKVISEAAQAQGAKIFDYKLEAQFRCAGSASFVSWIENTLEIEHTANVLWDANDKFEFRIVASPEELDRAIRRKLAEKNTARLMAGFCWKWSNPMAGGTLVDDVGLGDFRRSWNAKPDSGRLAPGIPKASLWAYDSRGVDQIGCVYTAQGFEFDYTGVIVGPDLVYRHAKGWVGQREHSFDTVVKRSKESFLDLVKNTYRVLFSRAMKGCYVYFVDKETEAHFRNCMVTESIQPTAPILPPIPELEEAQKFYPFVPRITADPGAERFVSMVPLYSLEAAAGSFGELNTVDCLGWVKAPSGIKVNQRHFVAKVVGRSMEPKIRDGAYCVFSLGVVGSRAGRIVLAQHSSITDPETGGSYTVKKYSSTKIAAKDGGWQHTNIELQPINPNFKQITITPENVDDVKIIAEFVAVLES
jgi:phage repressor protein C with HTH and peptisase S24 domain